MSNARNRMMHLDVLVASLQPGERQILPGRRAVWGCFAYPSALCLEDNTFLFIAGSSARQREAISAYANRCPVETLFGCYLKSRGFDLKTLIDPMDVSILRTQAVMFDADFLPHLIQ